MKSLLAFALLITLGVIVSAANAEERACRPSLSNFYHCPDTSNPTTNNTKATAPTVSGKPRRTCTPSLSNGYSCAPTSKSVNRAPVPSGASEESKGYPAGILAHEVLASHDGFATILIQKGWSHDADEFLVQPSAWQVRLRGT